MTDAYCKSKRGYTTVTTAGSGTGDVVGPASATDNALARFDGTTGKLLQNSNVTLDDTGNMALAAAGSLQTDTILMPGTVDTGDVLTIASGDNTADRTLTLTAGTDLVLSLDSGVIQLPTAFNIGSTDTGLARSAAGVVKVTNGSTGNGILSVGGNATAATPVIRNTDDTDTGFNFGSDLIYFNVAGVQAANIQSSGGVRYFVMTEAAAVFQFNDTWLFRNGAAGLLGVGNNGKTTGGQITLEPANGHRFAAKQVTLTEAGGAETVVTVTTTAGQMTGGRIMYTVRATDATDLVARSGAFSFVCINAATAVTATLGATTQADDGSVLIATGGATLTYAIAADVATANTLKITFDIDSSLVVSAASITYTVILNGPGTVA